MDASYQLQIIRTILTACVSEQSKGDRIVANNSPQAAKVLPITAPDKNNEGHHI
jgi:hypothetical protein